VPGKQDERIPMIWKESGYGENAAQQRLDLLLTWLAILTSFRSWASMPDM